MGWNLTLLRIPEDAKIPTKLVGDYWQLVAPDGEPDLISFGALREVRDHLVSKCLARTRSTVASDNTEWFHWPGDQDWGFDIALRHDPEFQLSLVDIDCRYKDFMEFFAQINARWPRVIILECATRTYHDEETLRQFWTDFE